MKLFILLLMQVFIFMPLTGNAAEGKSPSHIAKQDKSIVTEAQKTAVIKTYGKLPLYFIENNGQVDKAVKFYERGAGHATFFTEKGVVLTLTKGVDKASHRKNIKGLKDKKSVTEAVTIAFVGASGKAEIKAANPMPGRVNYFVGNDKTKWRTNIPTYGALTYENLYKNVDIKFYGNNSNIEHDVIIHPGGDFSEVIFAYSGIKGLNVTKRGDIEVSLDHGKLIQKRPFMYQEINGKRVEVAGSYRIVESKEETFAYGFTVASYDHTKDLVIDPVLVYSTYLGGSSSDVSSAIAVDRLGAAYVAGTTTSTDFPLMNPLQGNINGFQQDAFITKINPDGTALVYSTYLGGTGVEEGASDIAVDITGSVYVTGLTNSTDFPLKYPLQGVFGGVFDAFITKINPAGSALLYSTYLGGSGYDQAFGIAVDSVENAYVTGKTNSPNFPLVLPMQLALKGRFDAFVTKIDFIGSSLVYSTYLGGSMEDSGTGIAVDIAGSAYVTGGTVSTDFPTMSPMQGTTGGGYDVFITKMSPGGTVLDYSTYLGGSGEESGFSIAVDSTGHAYVTGQTSSMDFPLMNAIQNTNGGANNVNVSTDVFVTKISVSGMAPVYSTYLGGFYSEWGADIAVDSSGNAYVTGNTWSTDFPLAAPMQVTLAGYNDAFVTMINPAGSSYVYSTYLGGSSNDMGSGIALDASGNTYVAGATLSSDFPVMTPIQGVSGGSFDSFITKLSAGAPPPPPPAVTLALTPDSISIARGGILGYNVKATNTTALRMCFQYWENVKLPGGALYPVSGSLLNPVPRLCLNSGTSKTVHLIHGMPMFAPVGAYVFNAYIGIYPIPFRAVVDKASFNFNVTAFGPLTNHPETSWRLIENGFKN